MICPNCNDECWRESVDVGVGIIYGPWGCQCGWSEDETYNQLTGIKTSEDGYIFDQFGGLNKSIKIVRDNPGKT